jgi:hypothetical protein
VARFESIVKECPEQRDLSFEQKIVPSNLVGVAGDRGTGNRCYLATNKTAANIGLIIGVGLISEDVSSRLKTAPTGCPCRSGR